MNTKAWLNEMTRRWGRGDELALSLWRDGYPRVGQAIGALLAAHCDACNALREDCEGDPVGLETHTNPELDNCVGVLPYTHEDNDEETPCPS